MKSLRVQAHMMLCFQFFMLGYLANAIVRRVSMPEWPSDTIYPIICFGLTLFQIGIQAICLKLDNDQTP